MLLVPRWSSSLARAILRKPAKPMILPGLVCELQRDWVRKETVQLAVEIICLLTLPPCKPHGHSRVKVPRSSVAT
jgi:hypothetical protein